MFPHSLTELFNLALWLSGIGHFVLLIASFQVPYRLDWKRDLAKLTPFNRKLMWVHGGTAVFTIISFGVLSLALHGEMLHGERAGLGLAAFIGLFWLIRIIVDFVYYDHADWPKGAGFAVGHVLLTSLFCFLAATNLAVFSWNVWFH
jgi:alginate O-acetyltransferase complex protein AlgI